MTLKILREAALQTAPAAVVFDLDNTLYGYDGPHAAGMVAAEAKIRDRLRLESPRFRREFDAARRTVKERLEGTASSHSRLLYFQTLLERLGMNAQVLFALDLEQTYWRAFLAAARLFPDARDLIRELRSARIRVALLTDLNAQIQFRKLVYFGLDQSFDVVVTSEEAGRDKPAPEMFALVTRKLRDAEPADILLIGDNPKADIAGARSYGMRTAQKLHAGVQPAHGDTAADLTFEHFMELRREFYARFGIGAPPTRFSLTGSGEGPIA